MSRGGPGSIGEYFLGHLATRPKKTAFWQFTSHGLEPLTWSELATSVARALEQIDECGAGPGAHVATWLPNGLEWVAIDLAAQLRGLVHVALDPRLPSGAVARLAEHASAHVLLTTAELARTWQHMPSALDGCHDLHGLPVVAVDVGSDSRLGRDVPTSLGPFDPPRPDSLAQVLFTSGTMSDPKGVMLSHRNLLTNALAKLAAAPQFADDTRLNILPFAHAYARTCELSTWIISGSQLCVAHDWVSFMALAPQLRPTLINLVPHLAHKLVADLDLAAEFNSLAVAVAGERLLGDRLRLLQVGGAALSRDVWNRLVDAGWPPLQGYGLTESSPVICSNRAGEQRPETVGPPVQGVELRLDQLGVLWTRGPHVMLGYWKLPTDTATKIVDGWLCTEDIAEVTDDGHWRIVGRADDQISLATGYKASPHELARPLACDAWIEQLVIVGQDRPFLAALVHPRVSALPIDLFSFPNASTASPMLRRDLSLLDEKRFEHTLVERWSALQADLPRHLRIERVGLLREPLTIESGGLNFKGAIRRKYVEQVLRAEQVAALYVRKS